MIHDWGHRGTQSKGKLKNIRLMTEFSWWKQLLKQLLVIVGAKNHNFGLHCPTKHSVSWEKRLLWPQKWLILHHDPYHWKALRTNFLNWCIMMEVTGEHIWPQCLVFFNLPFRGYWGQRMFPYDVHQDAPIQKAFVTMDDIQATFTKELWVLEDIGGHNLLDR